MIQQQAFDHVMRELNIHRFGCVRVKGGLSFTEIMATTHMEANVVEFTLKKLLLHKAIMVFHVDGTGRELYYIRPNNWKD